MQFSVNISNLHALLFISLCPPSFLPHKFTVRSCLSPALCHLPSPDNLQNETETEMRKKRHLKHNTAKKKMEKDSSNGRHKTSDSLTNAIELTRENVEMHHSERCEDRMGKSEECNPGDSNSSVGCQEVDLFVSWSLKHAFKKANETKSAFQNPFGLLQNKFL